jgi:peptidoglycan/xylan/chitin deacetylase (PgdA/CDA1 family)
VTRVTRTVAVTFDNLGEASEIDLGTWPHDRPRGEHSSVVESLPRVLALLADLDLRATFFVEGINAELYPDALGAIAGGGHEVACHAWCHEDWGTLEPAEEEALLRRATEALGGPQGFRPPGGRLNPGSAALLRAHGYRYASPAAGQAADGLALLPFRWDLVDAYHQLPLLKLAARGGGSRRLRRSALARRIARLVWGRRSAKGVAEGRDAMLAALRDASQQTVVLLFHPFLLEDDAALQAAAEVLGEVARSGARVAPCAELV